MIGLLQKFRAALAKNRRSPKLQTFYSRGNLEESGRWGEASRTPASSLRDTTFNKGWLQTILVTSLGVTVFIAGIRDLRWLQPWELRVYDQTLRSAAGGSATLSRPQKASVDKRAACRETSPYFISYNYSSRY